MKKDETDEIQVYRIYIKCAATLVWDAITRPEWTQRYSYEGQGTRQNAEMSLY